MSAKAIKKERKKRTTLSPNYKWDTKSNELAYYCFRVSEEFGLENKIALANKLKIRLSQLDNRIQHYKSLTLKSKNVSARPSKEVVDIFNSNESVSDAICLNRLKLFLQSSYVPTGLDEEIETEEIEKVSNIVDLSNLDGLYKEYWLNQVKYQKSDLSELDWNNFLKLTSTMNIKTRGIKIEKRIIEKNRYFDSKRYEEGDAWLPNDNGEKTEDGLEIKTSFITPLKGSSVSIAGIRLWEEKVKYYLLIVVDLRNIERGPISYFMWVPKEEMKKYEKNGKLTIINMKKTAAKNNINIPMGLSLNDSELADWLKKYPVHENFKF